MTSSQAFVTCPLPTGRNMYGRPTWEPPILFYTSLIGEEYVQKRKAYLQYTFNNVAKTTFMMDVFTEYNLLRDYCRWTDSSARFARAEALEKNGGEKQEAMDVASFWEVMNEELLIDYEEVIKERMELKVQEYRYPDGRWEIVEFTRARGGGDVPWRDPVMTGENEEKMNEAVGSEARETSPHKPHLQMESLNLKEHEKVVAAENWPEPEKLNREREDEAEYLLSHDLFTFWS